MDAEEADAEEVGGSAGGIRNGERRSSRRCTAVKEGTFFNDLCVNRILLRCASSPGRLQSVTRSFRNRRAPIGAISVDSDSLDPVRGPAMRHASLTTNSARCAAVLFSTFPMCAQDTSSAGGSGAVASALCKLQGEWEQGAHRGQPSKRVLSEIYVL